MRSDLPAWHRTGIVLVNSRALHGLIFQLFRPGDVGEIEGALVLLLTNYTSLDDFSSDLAGSSRFFLLSGTQFPYF